MLIWLGDGMIGSLCHTIACKSNTLFNPWVPSLVDSLLASKGDWPMRLLGFPVRCLGSCRCTKNSSWPVWRGDGLFHLFNHHTHCCYALLLCPCILHPNMPLIPGVIFLPNPVAGALASLSRFGATVVYPGTFRVET